MTQPNLSLPPEGEAGSAEEAPRSRRSGSRPSDWGSLVADLSRNREGPEFHVHDRTHVEFAIDYRLKGEADKQSFSWEAYFFAPESLRLDSRTYDKSDIYTDLQSYVRFEPPAVEFAQLATTSLECVSDAIESGDEARALRELRLFACEIRAAGVELRGHIVDSLDGSDQARSRAFLLAGRMATDAAKITGRFREVIRSAADKSDGIATGARWVDEDISRLLETLLAYIARRLEKAGAPANLTESVSRAAIAEAQYRLDENIGGVGRSGMKRREIEALEFRRHVLKRFTSSVLWLSPEVRPASTWVLQLGYAVAASLAMAFAILAAIWNGFQVDSQGWITWVLVAVVAYAIKDRMKAILQTALSNVVERHFPDRHWRIRDRERGVMLGTMQEQSGFIAFNEVPADVLKTRRLTRRHPLEETARPETVIFHRKQVVVHADRVAEADGRFKALTEIFRLDLGRWLAHTDDPKRDIVFADPLAGEIGAAEAPRVYNIAVVYRQSQAGEDGPWHRLRVVVTRKGIRRIEHIA